MTTKNLVATVMAAILSMLLLTAGTTANTQADAKSVTSEATHSYISSPSNFGEHHYTRIDRVIVKQHVIKKTITRKKVIVKKVAKSVKTYSTSASLQQIMKCIANRESHNIPTARRKDGGTASGLFGFIDGTWNNYKGYAHAWQAPRAVQVEKFLKGWAYWKSRYNGRERMNPWYYAGHKQCW